LNAFLLPLVWWCRLVRHLVVFDGFLTLHIWLNAFLLPLVWWCRFVRHLVVFYSDCCHYIFKNYHILLFFVIFSFTYKTQQNN
jgi:hypothetical protein